MRGRGPEADTARELGIRVADVLALREALEPTQEEGAPGEEPAAGKAAPPDFDLTPPSYMLEEVPLPENVPVPTPQDDTAGAAFGALHELGPPPELPERMFGKGARVKIVGGVEGVGEVGEIFWWGESKFGQGMRAGVSCPGEATPLGGRGTPGLAGRRGPRGGSGGGQGGRPLRPW